MKDIELNKISRYRGELMGAAMLFIILFHVGLPRNDMFFGLRRMGNIGVDMFFFLSGMGLWFAWSKGLIPSSHQPSTPNLQPSAFTSFYKRRFLRIFPAWLIMSSAFYIPRFFNNGGFSTSWIDLIGDITINWDFWLHDELTFWYIPATMVLYLLAPPYMELVRRHPIYRWLPVAMVCWCVIVQWVTPVHQAVGHIEIFWSRVPIFFIGINMGEMIRQRRSLDGTALWMVLFLFVLTLSACIYLEQVRHGKFPLFIERMLYIPLTVTGILLLNELFDRLPEKVNACFRFVGTISLEIYLIHVHFILVHLEKLGWSYWPKVLACVALTLPAAWLLHWLLDVVLFNRLNHTKPSRKETKK